MKKNAFVILIVFEITMMFYSILHEIYLFSLQKREPDVEKTLIQAFGAIHIT